MKPQVLQHCQRAFPGWEGLSVGEVDFDDPKGFSSFTMAVRPQRVVEPAGVFYRRLAGKENAILEPAAERDVFLELGERGVAAHCHAYEADHRLEALYEGRTLLPEELREPAVLRGIAEQLARLHQTKVEGLPTASFFELLGDKWARLAEKTFAQREHFPAGERALIDDLKELCSERTREMVRRCLPAAEGGDFGFSHNDTYQGNIMRLAAGGEIRLQQNHPSVVVQVGETTVALDREICSEIFVLPLER